MNIKIPHIPNIPNINIPKVKVDIPKTNVPSFPKVSSLETMDVGYQKGYDDGYSGSSNLSEGKDTVNNYYWLGYSCGHRDGKFDRENGRQPTC